MLRKTLKRACGFGLALRLLCMPWLLLLARIWFGQVVLVHQIMTMAESPHGGLFSGGLRVPSGLDAALHSVVPLLLTLGLLTRPVALVLLIETIADSHGALAVGAQGAKLALLSWFIVSGAGAISLDNLLGRGLSWIPFRPVRLTRGLYVWLERHLGPLLQFVIRVGLAASLVDFVLPFGSWLQGGMLGAAATSLVHPAWCAAALALALVLGCATRFAALFIAAMVPVAGIAMSMDDRLAVLLLLAVLVAAGGGMFSLDWLFERWTGNASQEDDSAPEDLPHVVVVGGGFGGVAAAQGLRNARCRVTLIDQRNHHLFQPLLYQVATAALSPAEIATPIRSLFRRQRNVQVRLGQVTGVDAVAREVHIGVLPMKFDYLVLATGARHSYFGKDSWAPFAPGLKSIEDATAVRSRLLRAFEEAESAASETERAAWLTFVIVGGGPTGIELAGAIAELARHGMAEEYRMIDPAVARVILLQSGPRILPTFAATLSGAAERSLRALGVDVRLDTRVLGVDSEGVDIGGQRIAARTVLWAAGVAASPAAQWLNRTADPSGRLAVAADLSVPDLQRIYAIGDTASSLGWGGAVVPGLAPAAKQQGRYVAGVIAASVAGRRPPPPFRYRHFGSLATIGRQAAVAEIGKLCVWGEPAWWFWGATHIAFLVGGRNRAIVILDWLWAYLTYRRSTRLITGDARDEMMN
ncbi:NAD(P)/FAD-dependent oxidoreductase [Paraburkholderia sp. BL25I1N1]|uniref:NAD(P)/FAD-dependent oxidoreductase n=1 Tax=Paraburkholderia sp. BL25I1N1 TaxID=1938804 RepID=UPI000D05D03E|nr:NAD(P)/FAD-dependent oxidoreductase [Paraburkholderia sp. BL25I1N1]PRY07781.1 putative oxidoreductase [Paraburkholderia sp. BL25I1N1]